MAHRAMDLFEIAAPAFKDESSFIKNVCKNLNTTPHNIHEQLTADCVSGKFDSPLCRGLSSLFRYDCLCGPSSPTLHHSVDYLFTKLFVHLVAGPKGIDELSSALKNYDYSARCSLVWTGDYFAYRCRTCGLTPSMSLCGACFTAGNHEGHDFNKFKSMCGGACDCGDAAVIKATGNCRYHGPDKVAHRPCPPCELTAALEFLLPKVLTALMYWFWDHLKKDEIVLNESKAPMLFFLHRLHSCGWVTQKLMADALTDPEVYSQLVKETSCTQAYKAFGMLVEHTTLLDAFLFTSIKLRFPEGLNTLLIGLLAVTEFKEKFLNAYVDHYSRMASTLMITARARNTSSEASLQMNNRIVHISVQLFSGEEPALQMVKKRNLHILIVTLMRDMFSHCRTRLDDRGNMVVNCDGNLIQNNAFWPLTSDLNNLLSHKSVCDLLIDDDKFLDIWTEILKYMQFMNCFSMKEGSHIEYDTMAFYHGLTMEIEVGITSMWYIWQHYQARIEKQHCLKYTSACLSTMANQLAFMGRLVPSSTQWAHPIRGPLSLHLPLSRHAACFLSLAVITHNIDLKQLMRPFLEPNPTVLRRLMEELGNVLLGCHEVLIGYWVRNGQSIRQSIMHYMQSQLCYSMIDLDIFLFQVCAVLLHPAYILNTLVDQSRLLQNFCFHRELMALTGAPISEKGIDRVPMAIEAWLTNLCWILDLRNNLGLTESELIEKELVCFLAPDSKKRSDLACLLPDRCGLPSNSTGIDKCLEKVANYSAPSCDNLSGSLVSGHYFLKPELWHDKFDPVFYSLRISSRRDLAATLEKYRTHCRQTGCAQNASTFWPPYCLPPKLSSSFADLENLLHSRHLHYLLFCLLSLYAYGDPLMTEESLAMVVHLLYRAVVAGAELLKGDSKNAKRLNIADEPGIPRVDPIECTEAFMAATNREAELDAMMFADTDAEDEEDEEESQLLAQGEIEDDDEEDQKSAMEGVAAAAEHMEVDNEEPPAASSLAEGAEEAIGSGLRRTNAFKVRKPPPLLLKWDLSIVACPYPSREPLSVKKKSTAGVDEKATEEKTRPAPPKFSGPPPTIFDNMGLWLTTSEQSVERAQTESAVTGSGLCCSVPKPADPTRSTITDSLLTLLVKTHARLDWNRVVNSADGQAATSSMASGVGAGSSCGGAAIHDSAFLNLAAHLDPQGTTGCAESPGPPDVISALAARAMVVLNETNPDETSTSPLARAIQAANASATASHETTTSEERTVALLKSMAPELRYFAVRTPAYKFREERSAEAAPAAAEEPLLYGDGAFWVSRLLDKICETSKTCEKDLRAFVERASDPFDMAKDAAVPSSGTAADQDAAADAEEGGAADNSLALPGLQSSAQTRAQRKRAASERRKRLLEMMASKQRAFASTFLKDIDMDKLDDDTMENLDPKMEHEYECVICQASTPTPQPMVLLVMMCESGLMQQMRNYPDEPQLVGERLHCTQCYLSEGVTKPRTLPVPPPEVRARLATLRTPVVPSSSQSLIPMTATAHTISDTDEGSSSVGIAPRRPPTATLIMSPCGYPSLDLLGVDGPHTALPPFIDPVTGAAAANEAHWVVGSSASGGADIGTPVCFVEARKWWCLALPLSVSSALPLLKPGVLLQTCGHAVHRECFQRYRNQSMHHGGASATRWWATCPLCRRDVHYLLPLHRNKEFECAPSPPPHHTSAASDHLTASSSPAAGATSTTVGTAYCGIQPLFRCLRDKLAALPKNPPSFWKNVVGYDEEDPHRRRSMLSDLIGRYSEAAVILRSQFEMELSVLMVCPSQYHNVVRRGLFQELMNYLRHVYRSPSDLLHLVDSLSLGFIDSQEEWEPEEPPQTMPDLETPSTFGLCNDPTDVLLTLLPHVWPNQDQFIALASACICLSYTRALVGLILGQVDPSSRVVANQRASINYTRERMKNIPSPLKSNVLSVASCLDHLLDRLIVSCPMPATPFAASSAASAGAVSGSCLGESSRPPSTPTASTVSLMFDFLSSYYSASIPHEGCGCGLTSILQTAANLDILQLHSPSGDAAVAAVDAIGRNLHDYVMARILPCLRIVALVFARWQDSFHVHDPNSCGPVIAMSLPFVGNLSDPKKTRPDKSALSKEFIALTSFIGLGARQPTSMGYETGLGGGPEGSAAAAAEDDDDDDPMLGVGPLLPFVQCAALRSGLTESTDGPAALDELIHRWINQISSTFSPLLEPSKTTTSTLTTAAAGVTVLSSAVKQSSSVGTTDASFPIPPPAPPMNEALRQAHPYANRPPLPIAGQSLHSYMRTIGPPWSKHPQHAWIVLLGPLMSIGRQLYPPRLIRPPRAFDDLFNGLHLIGNAAERHAFQENILCLVCGELFCARCPPQRPQILYEHAYRCEGFAGVALEINTSLVHVSLGTSTCEWGSIYLDAYGEEDLDLKRGKPLFLNDERFALLESQWLTHSFRHVLKHWRYN